jgi:isoleucyl-tRNA synthetase
VAFNSNLDYCFVQHETQNGVENLLVATVLAQKLIEKAGLKKTVLSPSYAGYSFQSLWYEHPFIKRFGRLFAGDAFVTADTGTGFVHIAPGHGLDDYNLGRQEGLPIYSPVDDDGRFTRTNELPVEQQMPAEMLGKAILEKHGKSEANEVVLHELQVRQALLHQEDYHHSYPHCWRSKTPVIFRAMDQWFIQIDHDQFRERALAEIDRVSWIPEWGVNRIKGAVQTRPDWCISRQRSWGVPIPAFYDAKGEPILDAQTVRNTADLIEKHGSEVWFEKSAAELWSLVKPKDWKGAPAAAKSNDTLDVWIDSGSSSRAVIARRAEIRGKEKPFQADMYLEGSDQHRGWFQSSLLLSLAGNGAAPFKTVLTHGFIVDAEREKISKSKQGVYEKPQTAEAYVKKYGADVVRLWVASQDYRNDIVVSDERINKVGETYRNLRNTLRFQLSNLYDFDPAKDAVPEAGLTGLDRWILGQFGKLENEAMEAYARHEFHVVYQKISQFAAVELSAIYHDLVKDRLYTDAATSPRRRSTQTALYRMVRSLCSLLSPILAFTADEAWEFIPGQAGKSVHLASWRAAGLSLSEEEESRWKKLLEIRERILPYLEKERQAKNIGKALEAKVILGGNAQVLPGQTDMNLEVLRELLNVSQLVISPGAGGDDLSVQVAKADGRKCERCWHWEEDVGVNGDHPTLCGRCVLAIKAVQNENRDKAGG